MTGLDLPPEEPDLGPWTQASLAEVADILVGIAGAPVGRARVIAVDGRSASGKSTFAGQVAEQLPQSVVIHTDDIAWHHSFFEWTPLMLDGVLEPVHRGESVSFRPPAWDEREREGSVDVPPGTRTVVIEGVGAARRELMPLLDAVVWVQSGLSGSRRRGIARDGGTSAATEFWDQWMAAEFPFHAEQRAWERADLVVNGSSRGYQPSRVLISRVSSAG